MAPGAIAYTWLGHAGREALAGDASAIRYGLLALGLLAAIAFLPRLMRHLRGGEEYSTAPDLNGAGIRRPEGEGTGIVQPKQSSKGVER